MKKKNDKPPLVSVYITNFNYGKYITQAIESVLNQTFQEFELIIIDDGSTDNSRHIIESYSGHQKIKVIFQHNKGLNVSNNIALRISQGKYIMRLDADDYLDPNALLVMVNLLEADDGLGLVFPDYYMVDGEGNVVNIEQRHSFQKDVTLFDQPAHGAGTMIRRIFLEKIGGYNEQFTCQDGYELWVRFVANYKVTNISTPLFYYRQHGENLTSNERKILETRAKIKEEFVKKNLSHTPDSIAVIPVRGTKDNVKNIVFTKLGNKTILEWKIDEALASEKVRITVVSSPDNVISHFINKRYNNVSSVIFHKRDESLARLNMGLTETVNQIISLKEVVEIRPQYLVVLSPEYPFIRSKTIDDAINTMMIFDTDSLISVRPDTNVFFQHDGKGMKSILNQEKFSKLEREALFRYAGGIIAVRINHFIESQQLISGVVGHIVIDQQSAHIVRTSYDIEIAAFLAGRIDK